MPRKPVEKISFLSESKVKAYRVWLLILLSILAVFIGWGIHQMIFLGGLPGGVFIGALAGIKLYDIYRGIKPVEFDCDFLYVKESGYEVIVPLDNIKFVEIRNVSGIYKVAFFDDIQSGREIFFKPSMIYPLDFSKQDAKVNILRSNIRKARSRLKEPLPKNALMS